MKAEKAEKIKQTLKETKERRENQVCRVYQLKLQNLSKKDTEKLDRLFLEAKWLRNFVIADIENRIKDYKYKEVEIKTPEGFEKREIELLSSQMKQEIIDQIKDDLKSLKKSKEKGNKTGKLKFKSEVRSIPLKQYGITYKLLKDRNCVKIQGVKKKFRVLGLHQIPEKAEVANAHLIKKPSGFYLHVTCYLPKEANSPKFQINKPVGVDFGVKNQLTLSSGLIISWLFPETKRLKILQRELSRRVKGSNNYMKTKQKLQKEWEYITNVRKDIQNRIFSFLKCYDSVAIQDENIKGWHSGLFGKQIQSTGIGGITSRLKHSLETLILVDRYTPTTKVCSNCGQILNLTLKDRIIHCDCGLTIDRDINGAVNILKTGLKEETTSIKNLPLGWREVTPVERKATARILGNSPYIRVSYASMKQEAPHFSEGRMSQSDS